MKKDRNRRHLTPDHSLPRSKILRGRRNFERLFEKSTVYNSDSIQLRFRFYENPSEGCFVGFVAPKKRIRKAVRRTNIKRLMREVFRTHQHFFREIFTENTFGFHALFIANNDTITFGDIKRDMIPLMKQARKKLLSLSDKTNKASDDLNRES